MISRTKLRIASLFSIVTGFFLGILQPAPAKSEEKAVKADSQISAPSSGAVSTQSPSGALDSKQRPNSAFGIKQSPNNAYVVRQNAPTSEVTSVQRPASGYADVQRPVSGYADVQKDTSQPSNAYVLIQKVTPAGAVEVPVETVFKDASEREKFIEWAKTMGIEQEPTFEDALFFRMESIMNRLDALEKR